jgi:hypothetical protein
LSRVEIDREREERRGGWWVEALICAGCGLERERERLTSLELREREFPGLFFSCERKRERREATGGWRAGEVPRR